MRYEAGKDVCMGDLVEVDNGQTCQVVGLADEAQFLPGLEEARLRASPGCALVRSSDGALHWRPFPGSQMVFLRSSSPPDEGLQRDAAVPGIDYGPVPPPLDHYFSLERVEVGDEVKTSIDSVGRIVAVISRHEYDASIDKAEWEYLRHGFLCASALSGSLTWYEEADEDLELLHRRVSDAS